jgi:hypothetical protein
MGDWLPELSNEPFAEQVDVETMVDVSVDPPRTPSISQAPAEFGRAEIEVGRIGVAADVDWDTFQQLRGHPPTEDGRTPSEPRVTY